MHTNPTFSYTFDTKGTQVQALGKPKKLTFLHQNEIYANNSYVSVHPCTGSNSSCQYRGSTLQLLTAGGTQLTWIQSTKERGSTNIPRKIHGAGFLVSTCTAQSASIPRACSNWDCPCCPTYTRGKMS